MIVIIDKLLLNDYFSIITALGVIVAMFATIYNLIKDSKKKAGSDVGTITEMRSDIKHIREKVDKFERIPERVTAVEESSKQAHKRIDNHENRIRTLEKGE